MITMLLPTIPYKKNLIFLTQFIFTNLKLNFKTECYADYIIMPFYMPFN